MSLDIDGYTEREFIEERFEEEGFGDADVDTWHDVSSGSIKIRVSVDTPPGYDDLGSVQTISDIQVTRSGNPAQLLSAIVRNIAQSFKGNMSTRVEWKENVVTIERATGYSVTCLRCGAEVSIDDLPQQFLEQSQHIDARGQVFETPETPRTFQMSEAKRDMILLGLLRGKCDSHCPNSPLTESFIRDEPVSNDTKW